MQGREDAGVEEGGAAVDNLSSYLLSGVYTNIAAIAAAVASPMFPSPLIVTLSLNEHAGFPTRRKSNPRI